MVNISTDNCWARTIFSTSLSFFSNWTCCKSKKSNSNNNEAIFVAIKWLHNMILDRHQKKLKEKFFELALIQGLNLVFFIYIRRVSILQFAKKYLDSSFFSEKLKLPNSTKHQLLKSSFFLFFFFLLFYIVENIIWLKQNLH